MALGEAYSPIIRQEIGMKKLRRAQFQSSIQQELPSRAEQEIRSANHLGDVHGRIVHHDGELVTRSRPPDHEVAEVLPGDKPLRTEMVVEELDRLPVRNSKTPAVRALLRRLRTAATGPGIKRLLVSLVRSPQGILNVLARAPTGVNPFPLNQGLQGPLVERLPLALDIGTVGAPYVRPLVPLDPQPAKVLLCSPRPLGLAPGTVEIFLTEHERAVAFPTAMEGLQKRAGVAQMQVARGRGSQSATVAHARNLWRPSNAPCMRRIGRLLILFFFVTTLVGAEVTPHKPIRVQRDARSQLTSMQTAITHFRSPSGGYSVDLVSVVHIGEPAYYKKLNQVFKKYDAVLYELVADPSEGRPVPVAGGESDNPLSSLQHGLSSMLGLDFQLDHIDYSAPNFVHADISPAEFQKSMDKRGESFMQILLRSLQHSGMDDPEAEKELEKVDLMGALMNGPTPGDRVHLRRAMALLFAHPEKMTELLEGPGGSTLVSVRNQKALSVLRTLLNRKKRIAIFYGAAHMMDMEKRLVKDFDVQYQGQTWLSAWDLRMPAGVH